jgi:hypothetical protein
MLYAVCMEPAAYTIRLPLQTTPRPLNQRFNTCSTASIPGELLAQHTTTEPIGALLGDWPFCRPNRTQEAASEYHETKSPLPVGPN